MKNKNWACPLIATAMASILIMYSHWIPANIMIAIGLRRFINLMEENVIVDKLLREK